MVISSIPPESVACWAFHVNLNASFRCVRPSVRTVCTMKVFIIMSGDSRTWCVAESIHGKAGSRTGEEFWMVQGREVSIQERKNGNGDWTAEVPHRLRRAGLVTAVLEDHTNVFEVLLGAEQIIMQLSQFGPLVMVPGRGISIE